MTQLHKLSEAQDSTLRAHTSNLFTWHRHFLKSPPTLAHIAQVSNPAILQLHETLAQALYSERTPFTKPNTRHDTRNTKLLFPQSGTV